MKNAFIAVFFITAFFAGCTPESESDYAQDSNALTQNGELEIVPIVNKISPPMEEVNVPSENFVVEASEGERIVFENGTEIIIPAGALVDEDGIQITGRVDFSYREFHDVADILLSGIPMSYDSAGASHTFQTAGMMEIRASQNGKPVYIDEGKEIEVKLASFVDSDGYNLYSLNEETGAWTFEEVSTSAAMPVSESDTDLDFDMSKLNLPEEPYQPQMLLPGETPFEFDIDYSEFPQLSPYKDLVWQLAKTTEAGVVKPENIESVFGEIWNSAGVEEHKRRKGLYYLTLNSNSKEAKLLVTPVVEEDSYETAMAVYQDIKRKQEARKAQMIANAKARISKAQRQARIQRAFTISSFGIYNCDRIYNMPVQSMVIANFEIEDYDGDLDQVYLVMRDDKSVVTYYKYGWNAFKYSPATPSMIVAFLPDNQIAIFDENDFEEQKPRGNYTFMLKRTGKKVLNAADLKSAIGV